MEWSVVFAYRTIFLAYSFWPVFNAIFPFQALFTSVSSLVQSYSILLGQIILYFSGLTAEWSTPAFLSLIIFLITFEEVSLNSYLPTIAIYTNPLSHFVSFSFRAPFQSFYHRVSANAAFEARKFSVFPKYTKRCSWNTAGSMTRSIIFCWQSICFKKIILEFESTSLEFWLFLECFYGGLFKLGRSIHIIAICLKIGSKTTQFSYIFTSCWRSNVRKSLGFVRASLREIILF